MTSEKPTAAFVLSLLAGIFILIDGIFVTAAATFVFLVPMMDMFIGVIGMVIGMIIGIAELIFGIIVMMGAFMINSSDPGKVKTGGILVLIFSIISIIAGGGFIIGLILGLVGGILALTWKPSEQSPPQIQTPS